MRAIRALPLLVIPAAAAAHPGRGLIALDADTVIGVVRAVFIA